MNQLVGRRFRTKTEEGLSQRVMANPRINNGGGGAGKGDGIGRKWEGEVSGKPRERRRLTWSQSQGLHSGCLDPNPKCFLEVSVLGDVELPSLIQLLRGMPGLQPRSSSSLLCQCRHTTSKSGFFFFFFFTVYKSLPGIWLYCLGCA